MIEYINTIYSNKKRNDSKEKASNKKSDIAVVFNHLSNLEDLLTGLPEELEVCLLDSSADGLVQMTSLLEDRRGLKAIHLLTHGAPGALQLGSVWLNRHNLEEHADALHKLGAALDETGEILLYGCETAQGEEGRLFLEALHEFTGRPIAASSRKVGHSKLGGSWQLDVAIPKFFSQPLSVPEWHGALGGNTPPNFLTDRTGIVKTDIDNPNYDVAQNLILDQDGKILVVGYAAANAIDVNYIAIARYYKDGTPDTTFGDNGVVVTDIGSEDEYTLQRQIGVLNDGTIVVVGTKDNAGTSYDKLYMAKYNPSGNLLTEQLLIEYGEGEEYKNALIDSSGVYVVSVYPTTNDEDPMGHKEHDVISRFDVNGSLDTNFGNSGKVDFLLETSNAHIHIKDMIINKGSLYLVTKDDTDIYLAKIDSQTGEKEWSKSYSPPDGISLWTEYSLTVDSDGNIVIAGSTVSTTVEEDNDDLLLLKVDSSSGDLISDFGNSGVVTIDFGHAIYDGRDFDASVVVSGGKIIVAGQTQDLSDPSRTNLAMAVVNSSDGNLDATFDDDGKLTIDIDNDDCPTDIAIQDGKILVTGYSKYLGTNNSYFTTLRFNFDGTLDDTFGSGTNSLGGNIFYTLNHDPTILDNDVVIHDPELDAAGYNGATLTLEREGGGNAEDQFSGAGIVAGQASGNVTVSDTIIGTYTYSGGKLTITFNSNATQPLVQEAMRSIAYQNIGENPKGTNILINWSFKDGDSSELLTAEGGVNVVIDHVPTLDGIPETTQAVGVNVAVDLNDITVNDLDDEQLTVTLTPTNGTLGGLNGWEKTNGVFTKTDTIANLNSELANLTFTAENVGTAKVDITVQDSLGATVNETYELTADTNNTAPTFREKTVTIHSGKTTIDFGDVNEYVGGVAIDGNNKIVVVGGTKDDGMVSRLNLDGTLDTTFSSDGKVSYNISTTNYGDQALDVVIQDSDKILVAAKKVLVRYNADGSLDDSFKDPLFDHIGYLYTDQPAHALAIDNYSNIQLAGGSFAIERHNKDGNYSNYDSTNTNDIVYTPAMPAGSEANGVAIQSDDKIIVAGRYGYNQFAIVRFNYNGSLDTNFDNDGLVTTQIEGTSYNGLYDVAIDSDGKIVVAGYTTKSTTWPYDYDFAVARYNSDGSLDTSFGGDGIVTTDITGEKNEDKAYAVAIDSNGKIVVAGYTTTVNNYDFAVARYNSDGSLDTSFGDDGIVTFDFLGKGEQDAAADLVIDSAGRIVVAGFAKDSTDPDFAVARINPDGTFDSTFGDETTTTGSSLGGTVTYTEGRAPVVLDSDVLPYDKELSEQGNYEGATLTLERNGGASADDLFSGADIDAGEVSGDVTVSGTTVGTYTYSGGTLTITFNENATQSLLEDAMQSIAYKNSSQNPPSQVVINWIFSDGNTGDQGYGGEKAVTGSVTVEIESVNDDPTISGVPTEAEIVKVGQAMDLADFTVSDVDNDTLTVTLTPTNGSLGGLTDWTQNGTDFTKTGTIDALNADLAHLTFTATAAGDAGVAIEVNDGSNTVTASYPIKANDVPIPTAVLQNDTGDPNDRITKDGSVQVGNIADEASWEYSTDGGDTWTDGTDTTIELTGDGEKTIKVRQTTADGTSGIQTLTFTLDTTITAGTLTLTDFEDTGVRDDDYITTDNAFGLSVNGAETDASLEYEVSTDGGNSWNSTRDILDNLVDGTYQFRAKVTDLAGNEGYTDTVSVTIDTSAPQSQPTVLWDDTGLDSADGITKDAEVSISSLEDGAGWEYSTDGGTTWTTGTGTTFTLGDGTYEAGKVQVRQVDAAGNHSGAWQNGSNMMVDTIPPAVPTINVVAGDDVVSLSEKSAGVTVEGTAEASSTITIDWGGKQKTVQSDSDGDWSVLYSSSEIPSGGSTTVTATAEDVAGNTSDDATRSVTVQSPPPPAPEPEPEEPPAPTDPNDIPPTDQWSDWPDDDGDGVPEVFEDFVPGITSDNGQSGMQGDGNGDGISDQEQQDVASIPFRHTDMISQHPEAPVTFVTLVSSSDSGIPQGNSGIQSASQLDAPPVGDNPGDRPDSLELPLGLISFTATTETSGEPNRFSLFVSDELKVNGYWKATSDGWVNLASPEYGGRIVTVGEKIRLDFVIEDNGPFDSDPTPGTIADPGGPGYFVSDETSDTCPYDPFSQDTDGDGMPNSVEISMGYDPAVKDNDIFNNNELFVRQLYRDLLGREGDAEGILYWEGEMANGLSQADIIANFVSSPEFDTHAGAIVRLYHAALGRTPDYCGFNYWLTQSLNGLSNIEMSESFLQSAEFLNNNPTLSDENFIDLLYQNILGRSADEEGKTYWLNQITQGESRAEILYSFAQSGEYKAAMEDDVMIDILYLGLLDREPDQSGWNYWYESRTQFEDVAEFFETAAINQPEYQERFATEQVELLGIVNNIANVEI